MHRTARQNKRMWQLKRDLIEREKGWYSKASGREGRLLPQRHHFAHDWVRSRLYGTLVDLGCRSSSLILELGCGSGGDTVHTSKISPNVVGIDVADAALKAFSAKGFESVLGDATTLPFRNQSFDYVIASALLHHLAAQADLGGCLAEFARVTRRGGYVVALEPNVFSPSGLLVNVFNTIRPGITGLVPHERALSPLHLERVFRKAGLVHVRCVAASYVWNRFPLAISRFISEHENSVRERKPFNLFGWFEIVYGQKMDVQA